ncbi:hypothetical protein AVEN_6775-1 [Araneus ventricosus]|uniref:Uncharacterized protein n=1 Tax=Araneus ventricosus TaxID=182803 RepID=A0A4Y2TUK9_ARAVE|nr:hypothetical protein AVEN_6775-1 [Araneus ventricosus]
MAWQLNWTLLELVEAHRWKRNAQVDFGSEPWKHPLGTVEAPRCNPLNLLDCRHLWSSLAKTEANWLKTVETTHCKVNLLCGELCHHSVFPEVPLFVPSNLHHGKLVSFAYFL